MITLYPVSGEDSDTVRYNWDFHGGVLQHMPFQQKVYISFFAKRKDERSKQNLQKRSFSFCSNSCCFTALFIGPECLSRVNLPHDDHNPHPPGAANGSSGEAAAERAQRGRAGLARRSQAQAQAQAQACSRCFHAGRLPGRALERIYNGKFKAYHKAQRCRTSSDIRPSFCIPALAKFTSNRSYISIHTTQHLKLRSLFWNGSISSLNVPQNFSPFYTLTSYPC